MFVQESKMSQRNENFSFAWILFKQLLHRMSLNTHVTRKSIQQWLFNVCHKFNSSGPVGNFVLCHPNHFLLAGLQHCSVLKSHHYPTILRRPCSSKSRFFLVYQLHILTVSTFFYIRASHGNLLGISPSGRNPCGTTLVHCIILECYLNVLLLKRRRLSIHKNNHEFSENWVSEEAILRLTFLPGLDDIYPNKVLSTIYFRSNKHKHVKRAWAILNASV